MNLVTQSEFADKHARVTRQAISKAVKKGDLNATKQGRNMMIDLDDNLTIRYLKTRIIRQAHQTHIPGENNPTKHKNLLVKAAPGGKKAPSGSNGNGNVTPDDEEEIRELQKRYLAARMRKTEEGAHKTALENAYKRGELVSRDLVYNEIMHLLDRTFQKLELQAGIFLTDVGDRIITEGKVTPEIRKDWGDRVLFNIDEAKKQVIKNLKKIQKEQAG